MEVCEYVSSVRELSNAMLMSHFCKYCDFCVNLAVTTRIGGSIKGFVKPFRRAQAPSASQVVSPTKALKDSSMCWMRSCIVKA